MENGSSNHSASGTQQDNAAVKDAVGKGNPINEEKQRPSENSPPPPNYYNHDMMTTPRRGQSTDSNSSASKHVARGSPNGVARGQNNYGPPSPGPPGPPPPPSPGYPSPFYGQNQQYSYGGGGGGDGSAFLVSLLRQREEELSQLRAKLEATQEQLQAEKLQSAKLEYKLQTINAEHAQALQIQDLKLQAEIAQKKQLYESIQVAADKHRSDMQALKLAHAAALREARSSSAESRPNDSYRREHPGLVTPPRVTDVDALQHTSDQPNHQEQKKKLQNPSVAKASMTVPSQQRQDLPLKNHSEHSEDLNDTNFKGIPIPTNTGQSRWREQIAAAAPQGYVTTIDVPTRPTLAPQSSQMTRMSEITWEHDEESVFSGVSRIPISKGMGTKLNHSMEQQAEPNPIPSQGMKKPPPRTTPLSGTASKIQQDIVLEAFSPTPVPTKTVEESSESGASSGGDISRRQMRPPDSGNEEDVPSHNPSTYDMPISSQFTVGDNQSTQTSTFGEDRAKVTNKVLADPYGDKGIYSGVVLVSTGMPHGTGRMQYAEPGRVYDGEWRHGRWHGFGKAKFSNGDSYEGMYASDHRQGKGVYKWADGRVYDGEFQDDKRHGKGTFIWPDGSLYDGDFVNGQREGFGIYQFADGGRYEGGWLGGRYSGVGTCSWADGRCYHGEWIAGKAHGQGVETLVDGSIRHDGQWSNDEPIF